MNPLVIFAGAVMLLVGLLGLIAKALLVDEARGRLQRQIRADVEATIAALPIELQEEWGDEWRAELAAVISMPWTATKFARGLRQAADRLSDEATLGQSHQVPFGHVLQRLFGRYLKSLRRARDPNVAPRVAVPEGVVGVVGITLRVVVLTTPVTTVMASLVIYGEIRWWITGLASMIAALRVFDLFSSRD